MKPIIKVNCPALECIEQLSELLCVSVCVVTSGTEFLRREKRSQGEPNYMQFILGIQDYYSLLQ